MGQIKPSEERFCAIFNAVNDAILIHNGETGAVLDVNSKMCEMYGYSREEALQLHVGMISSGTAPYTQEDAMQWIQKALHGGDQRFEWRSKNKAGSLFWTEIHMHGAVIDGINCVVIVVHDIGERKKKEKALFKNAAEIDWLLKSLANAFVLWETILDERTGLFDLRFVYFNDAYEKYFGVKLAFARGKTVRELWPETEQCWYDIYKGVAGTGTQKIFEMYHKPTLGWYACNAYRLLDAPNRICVIIENITERKQAEEQLKQLTDLQKTILDTVTAGLTYVKNRKQQWANDTFCKMFGYDASETNNVDTSIYYANVEDYKKIGTEGYAQLAQGEVYSLEVPMKKKNGTILWCNIVGKALNPKNFSEGSIWMLQDVSQRRDAELAFKKSESILTATMESMHDGLLIVSEDHTVIHYNTQFRDMFHVPDTLFITRQDEVVLDYVSEQMSDPEQFKTLVKEIYLSVQRTEHIIYLTDGRILERRSYPLPDDAAVRARVWLFRDITEKEKAEEALVQSQLLLRDSQRVGHIGCWEYNITTDRLSWDEEASIIYGYHHQEFEPTVALFWQLVHPDDRSSVATHLERSTQEKTFTDIECRIIRPDGVTRTVLFVGDVTIDANGHAVRLYGIIQDITERKMSQTVLRDSEERFRTFIEQSIDGQLIVDTNGRLVEWNIAMEQMTGFAREEVLGNKYLDVMKLMMPQERKTPEVLAAITKVADVILATGKYPLGKHLSEAEIISRSGKRFIVQQSIFTIATNAGYRIGAIFRDVTILKQAEKEIRENEERLRAIIDNAPFGAHSYKLSSDRQLIFQGGNKTADVLLGLNHALFIGKTIDEMFPSLRETNIRDRYREVASTGVPFVSDQILYNGNEQQRIYEIYAFPTGQNQMTVFFRDVTDRKQAEELLRESEEKFEKTFKSSPAATVISEMETGKYIDVNEQWCTMLGYTREESLGHTSKEQGIWVDENLRSEGIAELRQHGYFHDKPVRFKTKSGAIRDTLWSAEIISIGQHDVMLTLIYDYTERKRAEEEVRRLNEDLERRISSRTAELQTANKELESFAYSVSHDLRAPLRAIDGYTRILVEDHAAQLDEEGKRVCGVVCNETQRMGRLIDDLLAFSRLSRSTMEKSAIDIAEMAESVFQELTLPAMRARVDFRTTSMPIAQGDPMLIRQVLVNLISNALKFSSKLERASIEVGSLVEQNELVYYIRDHGAGFDMQYIPKLFGVFQRLHSEREFEGNGVGLAIVQRVINRHGGRVWAEGVVNQGATFYFTIPAGGVNESI